ncbi:MAG: HNH endonuclease [Rhodococcus sp. (in: high G+C Gram-positive bacteria)]|nr:MAG: HNH endonuclease [Rhodococcus sp. (in: high G+C Gram-positive bacteria)]
MPPRRQQRTHNWGTGARARTNTAAHKARRLRVLARDHHICQIQGPRCTGAANICDHIINVKSFANPDDAERDDNCQAVCRPCHDQKTSAEGNAARPQRRRTPEPHPGLRRNRG